MQRNIVMRTENGSKKEIKKHINKLVRGLLIYELIMFFVVILDMVLRMIPLYFQNRNVDQEAAVDQILKNATNSGTASIISVFVGLAFLLFYLRRFQSYQSIFDTKERMTGSAFVVSFTFFMSVQAIFSILSVVMEAGFNRLGFSILGDITSATSSSSTLSMLLYASFLGPISEEIVFRGLFLRGLQKYGNWYAIVISAIVFGAFHGNLIQSIFAFIVGLVFGYVTVKYSIKWAIILHIMNNFVFGDLFSYLTRNRSDATCTVINYIVQAIFFVGMIVIVVMKREQIKRRGKEIIIDKKMIGVTFTSIWMLIFLTLQLCLALAGIERLQ